MSAPLLAVRDLSVAFSQGGNTSLAVDHVSFDIAKKRALLEAIRIRGEQTGDMTLAARNRTIDSEEDLDSVLEAFLRLGIIDEQGEIKN